MRRKDFLAAGVAGALDPDRFEVLSSHPDRSPILALAARDLQGVRRLAQSNVVVSTGRDRHDLIRISSAVYNDGRDADRVFAVPNG